MSTSDSQPDDVRTEELVAYLDGELPDEAARRVEQRLATDDDYRRQLGELDQAWSALEVLPTPTVDDKFARTTIEMVALAAQRDLKQFSTAETARRRNQLIRFAAAGLAIAAVGFAAARMFLPSQNRALMADLPVVVRIDELTQVGDLDFLRGLAKLDIQQFTSEDDSRTRLIETETPSGSWDNPESRRQWVEHLSADQKAELAGRLQRFQSLPGGPEEQRRMRQLEADIERAPDHADLQATMAAYAQWLSGQSQGRQAELRDLAAAQRVLRVQDLARQNSREAVRKLTSEEEQKLRDAVAKFADDHRTEMLEGLRRDNPEPQRRPDREPKFANVWIVWLAMRDEKWRDDLHTQLTAALSEPSRQYLEHLPSRPEQTMQLGRWVRAAMNPKFGPQELERFFSSEKLSNDQREQLLNLPQSEMESRLERWYAASQLGIPEQNWASFDLDRAGRGGPGGPGFGRGLRDRENGPQGRGEGQRGEGPRGEFSPRRFGPGGPPPDGPPPGGPREGGPRNGARRPGGPPPDDQDQPPPPGPPR